MESMFKAGFQSSKKFFQWQYTSHNTGSMSVFPWKYGEIVYFIREQSFFWRIVKWFSEFSFFYMGTVIDCYILEFDTRNRQMVLLGAYEISTKMNTDF